jgi:hypothetical protein
LMLGLYIKRIDSSAAGLYPNDAPMTEHMSS